MIATRPWDACAPNRRPGSGPAQGTDRGLPGAPRRAGHRRSPGADGTASGARRRAPGRPPAAGIGARRRSGSTRSAGAARDGQPAGPAAAQPVSGPVPVRGRASPSDLAFRRSDHLYIEPDHIAEMVASAQAPLPCRWTPGRS